MRATTISLPERVVASAQRGIQSALKGKRASETDRLWAYEIEQAANLLLVRYGLADEISVRTNGETVFFAPLP
jgi:hypothetical protein